MISDSSITQKFQSVYSSRPTLIARAPGRINLIGEHTDYNGGFVMPAAIEYEIKMAARPSGSDITRLYSANYDEHFEYDSAHGLPRPEKTTWYSYWLAVCEQFIRRGCEPPAMDVVIHGDVPLGAGLSSSAAFEVCAATLLNEVCRAGLAPKDIALLAQAAEHSEYVGVRCGIMDQFASALGAKAHALFLDCHSLDYEAVPFDPAGAVIVIINSNKPRELRSSDYNTRRRECEEGLALINEWTGGDYPTLRHIPAEVFDEHAERLPENVRKRVRHNISENDRVRAFVQALKAGDWAAAGDALYASHASLRDDYEVSCRELDAIVEIARESGLAHGCRMTGGGFGGCAVALVPPANVDAFIEMLAPKYQQASGLEATIYATKPMQGASVTKLER